MDAFGARLLVERTDAGRTVHDVGAGGLRRPARDVVIPAEVAAADVARCVDDLLHERATPASPHVRVPEE